MANEDTEVAYIQRYILIETIHLISEKFDTSLHSLGWYIQFDGSNESFYLSETEPELHAGDTVRITIEKV